MKRAMVMTLIGFGLFLLGLLGIVNDTRIVLGFAVMLIGALLLSVEMSRW